jgi:hypothetical protein
MPTASMPGMKVVVATLTLKATNQVYLFIKLVVREASCDLELTTARERKH